MIDQLLKENTLIDQLHTYLKDFNGLLITEDLFNFLDNKENQLKVEIHEQRV